MMRTSLTFLFVFFIFISLSAQSSQVKAGASFRNTNYISATGNPSIGVQIGYRYDFSSNLSLELNLGSVAGTWENVGIMNQKLPSDKDRSSYLEAIAFIPIFKKWIPSGRLKGGLGYIASYNSIDYSTRIAYNETMVTENVVAELDYFLHEMGIFFDYTQPITGHLNVYSSLGLTGSLNRAPAMAQEISGGGGRASWSKGEHHSLKYRFSVGVAYVF